MNKKTLILIILLSTVFAGVYTGFSFVSELRRPNLPIIGQVNDFTLTESNGKSFGLSKLKGKVWIADFFFTTCGDICPVMSKHMASLHRSFELVDEISLVSITVNPEFDSPDRLKEYAKKYTKNAKNWHFLTGDREKITELVVESFKLGSIEEPIFHSGHFTLVDQNGWIRGYYDGTTKEGINQIFKDASYLLKKGRRERI